LAVMAKYARNPGWFQWVRPGTRIRSKSAMIASKGSGSSGARRGSAARMSPGATRARTGYFSACARYSAIQSTSPRPCLRSDAGSMTGIQQLSVGDEATKARRKQNLCGFSVFIASVDGRDRTPRRPAEAGRYVPIVRRVRLQADHRDGVIDAPRLAHATVHDG